MIIVSLSKYGEDGGENVAKKGIRVVSDFIALVQMLANLELNSKGLHLRLQKEKEYRCLIIFTLYRSVASMYAHTPVRTAKIRRKMFNIISGKHSIVQTGLTGKFFALYWCLCVSISLTLLLVQKRTARNVIAG